MDVNDGTNGADQLSAMLIEDAADVREQTIMEFLFIAGWRLFVLNGTIVEARVSVCHGYGSVYGQASCAAPAGQRRELSNDYVQVFHRPLSFLPRGWAYDPWLK